MKFEWDENKRQSNVRKHEIDFIDANEVFEGETFTFIDERFDYDEIRLVTFGLLDGEVVAVVHTDTGKDLIRLISIRKATRNEEIFYFNQIAN